MPLRPAWLVPLLALAVLALVAAVVVILLSEGRPLAVPIALAAVTTATLLGVEVERRRAHR